MNPTLKRVLVAGAYMLGGAIVYKLGAWAITRLRTAKPNEASQTGPAAAQR
jgi:hypothetical protein